MAASAHSRNVCLLYRRILKNELSWVIDRRTWCERAAKISSVFHQRKTETNLAVIETYVEEAENYLKDNLHPDPYIYPILPGGSKFQRNTPPPMPTGDDHGHH
eukprot:TRINITY_DN750_c0_g2_i1.p1 TRINITY_DN750_c0_g2~~TRINITY_DN750_c0_g2_i1.p1  ORF type:complete len:103 (+),score=20.83 TRINITY_DN750_c0_g2_i1:50-358(+)